MSKLVDFPGGSTPDVIAEALRTMEKNIDTTIKYYQLNAKLQRAKYLALVDNGFTELQAIEIIKSQP